MKRYEDSAAFKPTPLVATIIERIDDMIVRGELAPGQRLIETDLAELLGVGRAPLREAIRILAGDGVVDLVPNRGARVRAISGKRIVEMLKVVTALTFMGLDEYIEQKQFRTAVRRLEAINARINDALAAVNIHALLAAMGDYGNEIAAHSDNGYLIEMLGRIHLSHYHRHITSTLGFADIAATARVYDQVTAAIRARDADGARRLIRETTRRYSAVIAASAQPPAKALAPKASAAG